MTTSDLHRNRSRKHRVMVQFILGIVATTIICVLAIVASPQERHEIVSDDFTKPRPTPTPRHRISSGIMARELPTMPVPAPIPERRYRFAASSIADSPPLSGDGSIRQLGLTLWRLRPVRSNEPSQRILIREDNKSSEWIPERIEMDTPLREGDHLRLSLECPTEGYLYVIDRVLLADNKMGEPRLIFPSHSLAAGANRVRPGKLVDLPGQDDDPNHFTVSPNGGSQVGKLLTIIITSAPLELISNDRSGRISAADLQKWEAAWGSESERFELVGGAGTAWTKEEKEAAASSGSRQLSREDPGPQTIYRIASTNKTGFLLNVRLSY